MLAEGRHGLCPSPSQLSLTHSGGSESLPRRLHSPGRLHCTLLPGSSFQHGLSLLNLGPSNLGTVAAYLGLYVCWDAFSFLLLCAGKAGRDASCSAPGRALGGLQDRCNLHVRGPAHLPHTCPFSTFGTAPTKSQGSSEPSPALPSSPLGHWFLALWRCLPYLVASRASLMAQTVKNLPVMWETWIQSLSWEYPLEEEMETHASILTWRIPWTGEPGGLQSMGLQRVRHD